MKRKVLDANALITFFENRAGAQTVEKILTETVQDAPLLLSVINWGEVYYSFWRAGGQQAAEQKLAEIARLPIEVVDVGRPVAKVAASLKAEYQLPYADSFAAALAIERGAAVITGDKDFLKVAKQVKIIWIGRA